MSTGSISDALSRVSAIQDQLQQLSSGALLDSALGISGTSSSGSSSSTATSDSSSTAGSSSDTDFANALASAEGTDAASATDTDDDTSTDSTTAAADGLLTGGVAIGDVTTAATSVALPSQASTLLTADQQQFASTLSADTGLSPSVVSAWLLAEESGSAAQTRQSAGNNDWLNVGYTDSGTYGASDSVWSDPTTAANATADWLQGKGSISGYGTASSGIQSILSSVGQSTADQIQAIQSSGWSSSGYPSLDSLYSQVAGS